jgi:hypothetical protein
MIPVVANLIENIVTLFTDGNGSLRGLVGSDDASAGGGGGGVGGGGTGAGAGDGSKLVDDRAVAESVATMDAAYEALVQVAVHFMTYIPEVGGSDSSGGGGRSGGVQLLPRIALPVPVHQSLRQTAAMVLKGLARSSTSWSVMLSKEVHRVLVEHVHELNNVCSLQNDTNAANMTVDLDFHEAIPTLLGCLNTAATNPFANGCIPRWRTLHQTSSSVSGVAESSSTTSLLMSDAAEDAFPHLYFALEALRVSSERRK